MERFMRDPNYRAERRKAAKERVLVPLGKIATRGYKRDWMFDGTAEIPVPPAIDPMVIEQLARRVRSTTAPLTDKITDRYDIYPYKKSAEKYGLKHNRELLKRIKEEETDPGRIVVLKQGAARSLEHIRDSLQWNLWLKKRISELRLGYVVAFKGQLDNGATADTQITRYAGEAIADVGYCLRSQQGLLANMGQDAGLANTIEHAGHYVAGGHPEFLDENTTLLDLTQEEQQKRVNYWGARYDATVEAFGNRLPDEELDMDRDLDVLIGSLYSQTTNGSQDG